MRISVSVIPTSNKSYLEHEMQNSAIKYNELNKMSFSTSPTTSEIVEVEKLRLAYEYFPTIDFTKPHL